MAMSDNFSDAGFLLVFIAMICNTVSLVLWVTPDKKDNAMDFSRSENCLFAHTVPAYMIVLIGTVLMYCFGEQPSQWFNRLFLGAGMVLFLFTGVVGLTHCLKEGSYHTNYAMVISFLCIVCGVLLLAGLLKNEEVF